MNFEEGLDIVNEAVLLNVGRRLSKVEISVLKGSWHKQTYDAIAHETHYSVNYLKIHVGPTLWKTLSTALDEPVTKINLRSVLERRWRKFGKPESGNGETVVDRISSPSSCQSDWGEAIDVSVFYGRTAELDTLSQWIIAERCRLVALLGMGGIGKTALSVKLAHQLSNASKQSGKNEFQFAIWRSLRNAPPLETLLEEMVTFLSQQQETQSSFSRLMHYLRSFRCLVVLDNFETVLQGGDCVGQFRSGYEDYGELLRLLGESDHQSCIILTSREKPAEVATFEGMDLKVRSLSLNGSPEAAQSLLQAKGLIGSEEQKKQLCDRYSNSPLALKIVATSIQDLFKGDIGEFLKEDTFVFNGLRRLLDQQFHRLSALEQSIMYWLSINRDWISIAELQEDLVALPSKANLLEALESLKWRSFIESQAGRYTQQSVVMEYVTDQFIEKIVTELESANPSLLLSHALIKATVEEYVRNSQIRLILKPIAEQLSKIFGVIFQEKNYTHESLERQIVKILSVLRDSEINKSSGYGGGNLINLCLYLKINLTHYDFSNLPILQADLQNANLQHTNFTNAYLSNSIFTQTFGAIFTLTFSPNGKLLATGDGNGEIRLWRVADSQPLLILKGHRNYDWVWSVTFSPDGLTLASGSSDKTIKLWDVTTGQLIKTLQGHGNWVTSVCFSPDGLILASGSSDKTIKLWDVTTGQPIKPLEGHSEAIRAVSFSPDGLTLASGSSDCTVKLWNITTGMCSKTLQGHENGVWAVSYAPFASTRYESESGSTCNPDNVMLASGSDDHTIKLWNPNTGEVLKTLEGHKGGVRSINYNSDGTTLVSGSYDYTVKVWDIFTGQTLRTLQGHVNGVSAVSYNSDNATLASGSDDQTVKLWDIETGHILKTLQGHTSWIFSVEFSPITAAVAQPGKAILEKKGIMLASGGYDHTIKLWDSSTGKILQTFQGHTNGIRSINFSPDGSTLASGSDDHTVKLWNVSTGKVLKTLLGHTSWVCPVRFSPDGTILATGSYDQTVKLWDIETGQILKTLQGHTDGVRSVSFSPDGKTLAGGGPDRKIRLWNVHTGEVLRSLEGHLNWVSSVAFSLDGSLLASSSNDGTVRLWDVSTGEVLRILSGHADGIRSVRFNPNGTTLVTCSDDHTVKVWNVFTGEILKTLRGHTSSVWSVSFSPDGAIVASGSADETVRLWNIETGQCLRILKSDRPYEGMNITGVTGISEAQKSTLQALGAIEN
jgi:WD40 repeat protein